MIQFLILVHNLVQALEMSIYTWSIAIFAALLIWLAVQKSSLESATRLQVCSALTILTGVISTVTSVMWPYYFNLLLSLPSLALLLFLVQQLNRIDRNALETKIAKGLVFSTIGFAFLSGLFFGVFI